MSPVRVSGVRGSRSRCPRRAFAWEHELSSSESLRPCVSGCARDCETRDEDVRVEVCGIAELSSAPVVFKQSTKSATTLHGAWLV
jgi:hypothetical protein